MDNTRSGITWFDEDKWIACLMSTDPQPSTWIIDRKLAENEDLATEADVKKCMMPSEAGSIFVCSNIDAPSQEAVVKARMQIPYFNTTFKSRQVRAQHADPDMRAPSRRELSAFDYLT
ncbi:uncharacterized protein P174DRAFT_421420 [Aspergillus novofumigatus IBT 16806]|uniref:Uncharacterized protein n=1 Tax=Aspergillus novofumigatus (strain IBT 16806) TaxID=1392255 RepID=A0A2I1C3Y5_ASPN1|nr:uncharacterized protein P174DRAFT_421420 [Aspergillus novofumigatus IBT 16806]PKX92350.1 hypothetical protein P174DRAFT_421420 [Aspergillus novofumigatus IBT 16806]